MQDFGRIINFGLSLFLAVIRSFSYYCHYFGRGSNYTWLVTQPSALESVNCSP